MRRGRRPVWLRRLHDVQCCEGNLREREGVVLLSVISVHFFLSQVGW